MNHYFFLAFEKTVEFEGGERRKTKWILLFTFFNGHTLEKSYDTVKPQNSVLGIVENPSIVEATSATEFLCIKQPSK